MNTIRDLSTAEVEALLGTLSRELDDAVRKQIAELNRLRVPFDTGVGLVITGLALAASRAIVSLPDDDLRKLAFEMFTTTIRRETPIMQTALLSHLRRPSARSH